MPYAFRGRGLGDVGGVFQGTITVSGNFQPGAAGNYAVSIAGGPPGRAVAYSMAAPLTGIVMAPFLTLGTLDSQGNLNVSNRGWPPGPVTLKFQVGVHPLASFQIQNGQGGGTKSFSVDTSGDYGGISMPTAAGYIGNTAVTSSGPQQATPSTPASILPGGTPTTPVDQAPPAPVMSNGIPPSAGGQQQGATAPANLCLFGDSSGQLDGLPVCTYTALGIAAAVGLLLYMGSRR